MVLIILSVLQKDTSSEAPQKNKNNNIYIEVCFDWNRILSVNRIINPTERLQNLNLNLEHNPSVTSHIEISEKWNRDCT